MRPALGVAALTGIYARLAPRYAGSAPGYLVEPDRRAAIALTMDVAAPGTIVLAARPVHGDRRPVAG